RRSGQRDRRGVRGGVRAHRPLPQPRLADRGGAEVDPGRRARRDDQDARPGPRAGDRAARRGGRGEGRERDHRDAVRHLRARQHVDRDLRVRHGRAHPQGLMPRARRPRRAAPALEVLRATRTELRRGLTEQAARTIAYELFEKLGYGAVCVTDTERVLAFVGAGADHHGPGDRPIRPVFEALGRGQPLLAPLAFRTECSDPACPLGSATVVPLRLPDGPAGAIVAYATDGSPLGEEAVELLELLGEELSAQLQLSELSFATTTALQAQMEPHFVFNALNTIASFIRTDPERARALVLAFADHLRSRLARPGAEVTLEEELRHVRSYLELDQARF